MLSFSLLRTHTRAYSDTHTHTYIHTFFRTDANYSKKERQLTDAQSLVKALKMHTTRYDTQHTIHNTHTQTQTYVFIKYMYELTYRECCYNCV